MRTRAAQLAQRASAAPHNLQPALRLALPVASPYDMVAPPDAAGDRPPAAARTGGAGDRGGEWRDPRRRAVHPERFTAAGLGHAIDATHRYDQHGLTWAGVPGAALNTAPRGVRSPHKRSALMMAHALAKASARDGFATHRSFAAEPCERVGDAGGEHLMHHLVRLEQSYQARLPAPHAADESLSFGLNLGLAAAKMRIANLFSPEWRKTHLKPDVAKSVARALVGPNPQGQCWRGWRRSGFGETQVSGPRPMVRDVEAIVDVCRRMWGGRTVVCEALPTTILRPPGGAALAAHIDSGSLLEMYVGCGSLLAAGRASALDWSGAHGASGERCGGAAPDPQSRNPRE